jgi:hypothetical protein
MRTAPVARGFFTGDYEGLAAHGTTFYTFSSESRGATDVFASRVPARTVAQATYTPSPTEGDQPASAFPILTGKPSRAETARHRMPELLLSRLPALGIRPRGRRGPKACRVHAARAGARRP